MGFWFRVRGFHSTAQQLKTAPVGTIMQWELDESQLILQIILDNCKLSSPLAVPTDITILSPHAAFNSEEIKLSVLVSPNPIKQWQSIQMKVNTDRGRSLGIQVFDLKANSIKHKTIKSPAGQSQHLLKEELKKGIYLLRIQTEEGKVMTGKLVVF